MNNEIIYAGEYTADISSMNVYKSKRVTIGYVKGTEIFPVGTKAVIRAMEGDQELEITEDTIIAVGVRGEVYITKVELFDADSMSSSWNQNMVIYQTINELSQKGYYDNSGLTMNQCLVIREILANEDILA